MRGPSSGSQGNMNADKDRDLLDFGVHLSMASLILGNKSWSKTLSRIKRGSMGSQASMKLTAGIGDRAFQSLLASAESTRTYLMAERTLGIQVAHSRLSQAVMLRSASCFAWAFLPCIVTASAAGRL